MDNPTKDSIRYVQEQLKSANDVLRESLGTQLARMIREIGGVELDFVEHMHAETTRMAKLVQGPFAAVLQTTNRFHELVQLADAPWEGYELPEIRIPAFSSEFTSLVEARDKHAAEHEAALQQVRDLEVRCSVLEAEVAQLQQGLSGEDIQKH